MTRRPATVPGREARSDQATGEVGPAGGWRWGAAGAQGGKGEAGFAGGLDGLVFGLLLFVVGTVLVAGAWGVLDTSFALDAAARQAVEAYVAAPDAPEAASDARAAAASSLEGYGRSPAEMTMQVIGAFARCRRVTVVLRYPTPSLQVPFVGPLSAGGVVSARRSEIVDPFLSGPAGRSSCP